MNSLLKQEGAAIIAALFITGLVAACATVMMMHTQQNVHRTTLLLNDTQINFYAQGSTAWAVDQLKGDFENKQPNKITDPTPVRTPVNKLENGITWSIITDAQGQFNLNNLIDPNSQNDFVLLIRAVSPETSIENAKQLANAVTQWITPNQTGSTDPLNTDYYNKLNPPYTSPHMPMASPSELRLVKGMTAKLYSKILPYVTALPSNQPTPINVNNAEAPVLMTLSPQMTLEKANAIVSMRKQTPFLTLEAFQNVLKDISISTNKITLESSYFLLETNVKVNKQQLLLYTLLQRLVKKDSKPDVKVLWQSKGTL